MPPATKKKFVKYGVKTANLVTVVCLGVEGFRVQMSVRGGRSHIVRHKLRCCNKNFGTGVKRNFWPVIVSQLLYFS